MRHAAAIGLLASGILYLVSLYQLEIVYIGLGSGWPHFDAPFLIFSLSFEVARDTLYALNAVAASSACIFSARIWGKRERERAVKDVGRYQKHKAGILDV